MTASERRKAIIELLCMRKFETRENLATEFGVSARTITQDLLNLSFDYPIFTIPGKGGGVRIDSNYRLNKAYMTTEQLELLYRILPTLTGKDLETMKSILRTYEYTNRRQ